VQLVLEIMYTRRPRADESINAHIFAQDRERKPKNQTQCIHFSRRGDCREGDRCVFLHGLYCPLDRKNAEGEASLRVTLPFCTFSTTIQPPWTIQSTKDGPPSPITDAAGEVPAQRRWKP
jgi:hypothetical protein